MLLRMLLKWNKILIFDLAVSVLEYKLKVIQRIMNLLYHFSCFVTFSNEMTASKYPCQNVIGSQSTISFCIQEYFNYCYIEKGLLMMSEEDLCLLRNIFSCHNKTRFWSSSFGMRDFFVAWDSINVCLLRKGFCVHNFSVQRQVW